MEKLNWQKLEEIIVNETMDYETLDDLFNVEFSEEDYAMKPNLN